jgi:hypothetical protein
VIIVEKVIINEINPEYVTLIFDNVSHPHFLSNILKFSYYMNKPVYIFKNFKKNYYKIFLNVICNA